MNKRGEKLIKIQRFVGCENIPDLANVEGKHLKDVMTAINVNADALEALCKRLQMLEKRGEKDDD